LADPTISVLLPVRDGGEPLREAIDSLAAQTCEDFEVIAVDDGSTDDTLAVLKGWAARDDRVTVLRREPEGIVAALEVARAASRGPYLARMDADDVALPTRFARQIALMQRTPELVACGSLVEYFPRERVRDGAARYEEWINAAVRPDEVARSIFVECPLAHPTLFARAAAVDAVGGYVDRGWPEDYDLLLRLWAAGGSMAKVPEVLVRWREGIHRLSRSDPRYSPGAFRACKVHYLVRSLLKNRPVVIWGAGPVGKALARTLRGAAVEVEAFVEVDPRKIGQQIHGAPVLDAEKGLARRGSVHLAAVGQPGARERLISLLAGAGFQELEDFVAVA
jgi:glycosyltransferase involved in cell wall biosynthesis